MDNYQIADNFSLLSKIMDIHGENSFKTKSYSIAAFQIEKLQDQLENIDAASISAIKGIGEKTGKKIMELVATGKLSLLEKYIADTPPGVLEMMNVKGIGPKKINIIWKELEIESVGELLYACNENRLAHYKGFGEKTEENIKNAVEFYLSKQGFFLFKEAIPFAHAISQLLEAAFPNNEIHISGDYRRHAETLEELTYVADVSLEDLKTFLDEQPGLHFSIEENDFLKYRMESGPMIKIYSARKEKIPGILFLTTGSPEFIDFFPLSHAEIDLSSSSIHSEKDIFETAGLPFIPPFLRDDPQTVEAVKTKDISSLIETNDIKGIIHSHSTWSDGVHSIRQMATSALNKGFEYLVISDHSRSAAYANGLTNERVAQQHMEIENLNKELAPFKIFKSIESDILTDGSLDYPTDILSTFDLVIASVHSGLKMSEEKATARLLKAIENPYTTILGHMTGRLLLSRSGYPVDHKKIIDACAANHVVIELNAHSRRLDMDWRWIPYALSKNALISIDPDAHSTGAFDDVKYGVLSAQKGMLTAKQNLSSFSITKFESFLKERRKLKMLYNMPRNLQIQITDCPDKNCS
jgi:DNA polymerase (family 10)